MNHTRKYLNAALLAIGVAGVLLVALFIHQLHTTSSNNGGTVQVVAAENFWGSLVTQLGGSRVHVVSIVSDPNADPHEYESNTSNARAIANANYVIMNGAGYDTWANKLVTASPNSSRKVLTVADILGKKEGDNPHFWYNPTYVNTVVQAMEQNLISIDPAGRAYYQLQYQKLSVSLDQYQNRVKIIDSQFSGTQVAATEDIFAYLASASGLNLVSPPAFTQAVAEGNDPPTSSIVQFQQQLKSGKIKLLVYNEQTVTPLTDTIKKLAAEQNIPIVGVTETIQPPGVDFQDWMNAQLLEIQNALNAQKLGQ